MGYLLCVDKLIIANECPDTHIHIYENGCCRGSIVVGKSGFKETSEDKQKRHQMVSVTRSM
jgi:hypothetical protein